MEPEVPPAQVDNECPVRTQSNPAFEHEEDDTQVVQQVNVNLLLRESMLLKCQLFSFRFYCRMIKTFVLHYTLTTCLCYAMLDFQWHVKLIFIWVFFLKLLEHNTFKYPFFLTE
jgi:hypothetical protein